MSAENRFLGFEVMTETFVVGVESEKRIPTWTPRGGRLSRDTPVYPPGRGAAKPLKGQAGSLRTHS